MAEFDDIITTRVVVDDPQAINQLGMLEAEAKELRNSMKAANEEMKEYTVQASQMKGLESGLQRITNQMIKLKGEGKENTQRFKDLQMMSAMTSDAIAQLGAKMQSTQRYTKEYLEAAERLPEVENQIRKLKDSMGVAGMTTKQLRQEQKTLKAQFDNTLQETEGYDELRKKLVEVNAELKKRNDDVAVLNKETDGFLEQIKSFGIITAANISGQAVVNAASVISDFAGKLVGFLGKRKI
jgi:chromosome segregation ATPase